MNSCTISNHNEPSDRREKMWIFSSFVIWDENTVSALEASHNRHFIMIFMENCAPLTIAFCKRFSFFFPYNIRTNTSFLYAVCGVLLLGSFIFHSFVCVFFPLERGIERFDIFSIANFPSFLLYKWIFVSRCYRRYIVLS